MAGTAGLNFNSSRRTGKSRSRGSELALIGGDSCRASRIIGDGSVVTRARNDKLRLLVMIHSESVGTSVMGQSSHEEEKIGINFDR